MAYNNIKGLALSKDKRAEVRRFDCIGDLEVLEAAFTKYANSAMYKKQMRDEPFVWDISAMLQLIWHRFNTMTREQFALFYTMSAIVMGTIAENPFNHSERIAEIDLWRSMTEDGDATFLLKMFDEWANQNKATTIRLTMGDYYRADAVDRLLGRCGFEKKEVVYWKKLV